MEKQAVCFKTTLLSVLFTTFFAQAQQINLPLKKPIQATNKWSVANAHSHNDYQHKKSFTAAYAAEFGSIEVDIFLSNDSLFVGHEQEDIKRKRMLRKLYLAPLAAAIKKNGGFPYTDTARRLQLLIDVKTDSISTLNALVQQLQSYPDIIHCRAVSLVITGNRPASEEWTRYPDYIFFDGRTGEIYPSSLSPKIAMISGDLGDLIHWDGKSKINKPDSTLLATTIQQVHDQDKKIRFWDAPDFKNAWLQLIQAGVDWINTDHIEKMAKFMNTLHRH